MSCQISNFLSIYLELGCVYVIQYFPSGKCCQFFRKFCEIIEFFPSVDSTNFSFLVEKLVKFSISHVSIFILF